MDDENPTGLTIEQVDEMDLYDLLKMWRFAPTGTFRKGDPVSEHFRKVMERKRAEDPDGWVRASKYLGH